VSRKGESEDAGRRELRRTSLNARELEGTSWKEGDEGDGSEFRQKKITEWWGC
jgi:hypothetical protein